MRLIICTVGVSVAKNCPSLRTHQLRPAGWGEDAGDLSKELDDKFQILDLSSVENVRNASAELNSLQRLNLLPDDHVVLLVTDTVEGKCCGECLAKALCKIWSLPDGNVHIERIEGLQVHDEARLRDDGLPNLMRVIMGYCKEWNNDSIILNPTGGFKGLVPFLTVLGMMYRLRTVYVFEFSNVLINLPPLPISLNEELLTRVLPALQYLHHEGAVAECEFLSHIVDYTNQEYFIFRPFVENDREGFVTLSNVFEPILEELVSDTSIVYLSNKALRHLESTTGLNRERLERLMAYASIPLWRSMHIHHFEGTDLPVFKPGNVSERLAGFVKGNDLYVSRFYLDHKEYERDLSQVSLADAESETFTKYAPKLLQQSVKEFARKRQDELERLEEENRELKSMLAKASGELKKIKEQREKRDKFLERRAGRKKKNMNKTKNKKSGMKDSK